MTVNFRRDGTSQLVVEIVLGNLTRKQGWERGRDFTVTKLFSYISTDKANGTSDGHAFMQERIQ